MSVNRAPGSLHAGCSSRYPTNGLKALPVQRRHVENRSSVHCNRSFQASFAGDMASRWQSPGADVQTNGRPCASGCVEANRHLSIPEASGAVPRDGLPASATTDGAADEVDARLTEVDVDNAVEDEVEREVAGDEDVGGDCDCVEQLDGLWANRVVVELEQLGRGNENQIHADDGDQGRRHPVWTIFSRTRSKFSK